MDFCIVEVQVVLTFYLIFLSFSFSFLVDPWLLMVLDSTMCKRSRPTKLKFQSDVMSTQQQLGNDEVVPFQSIYKNKSKMIVMSLNLACSPFTTLMTLVCYAF